MKAADLLFLVVEDHDLQRRGVLALLGRLGSHANLESADGESALKLFLASERPVDVIITDLDMPGMDGIEFIRHIGQSGKRVAVVLASAIDPAVIASIESVAGAYGVQLLGVMEKPVSMAKLECVLQGYGTGAAPPTVPVDAGYTREDIAQGLERGEFEAFFQPTVELATRRIRGFEALARWRHPRDGWVAPDAFIAAMEQHGLIAGLTTRMLAQAVDACGWLQAAGLDCCISVNVSIHCLGDVRFADQAAAVTLAAGLRPEHIVLEVTESAEMVSHEGAVLENLSRLRMKGFGLSIDDFGTGYSSMQLLNRIAFSELKIDRSFVRDAARNTASMVILRSSVDMARQLQMACVAEGIETTRQWDLLAGLGCELAQGYFIGMPMELGAVPGWATQWNATGA